MIHNNYFIVGLYLLILFFLIKIKAKEIIIHNEDENFFNLINVINNNQNDNNELVIRLVDDYYNMTEQVYNIELSLMSNVSIVGNENGTVIDYNKERRGGFLIAYSRNKWDKFTFKNLIFENYSTNGADLQGIQIISVFSKVSNIQVSLENCVFRNNDYRLFHALVTNNKIMNDKPQVIFKNCVFQYVNRYLK